MADTSEKRKLIQPNNGETNVAFLVRLFGCFDSEAIVPRPLDEVPLIADQGEPDKKVMLVSPESRKEANARHVSRPQRQTSRPPRTALFSDASAESIEEENAPSKKETLALRPSSARTGMTRARRRRLEAL